MATLLEKIAAEIAPDLTGVDWSALEIKFGLPREEVVYDTGGSAGAAGLFEYQTYLEAAYNRATESLKGITLTWDVESNPATEHNDVVEAAKAWAVVKHSTVSVGDSVLHALRANLQFLSDDHALVLDMEQLRAIVSSTYMTCLYGYLVHAKGMLQLAEVAPEDIVASADSIAKTFNALADMADMGILDPLKNPAAAPVGAIPVAVAIAISAAVGVGLISWCIVEVIRQQSVNKAIELVCEDAVRTGDADAQSRCADLVKLNKTSTSGGPLGDFAISIGQAALMVGVAYGMFLLLPVMAKFLGVKKGSTT